MDKKTPFSAKHVCIMLAIAVFAAVVMTVLSGVPPLSGLYNWLAEHDMEAVWVGLTAGVI